MVQTSAALRLRTQWGYEDMRFEDMKYVDMKIWGISRWQSAMPCVTNHGWLEKSIEVDRRQWQSKQLMKPGLIQECRNYEVLWWWSQFSTAIWPIWYGLYVMGWLSDTKNPRAPTFSWWPFEPAWHRPSYLCPWHSGQVTHYTCGGRRAVQE